MTDDGSVVNRREFLKLFSGSLLAARGLGLQERGPEFSGLDHFEFYVSNPEKSRDLFVRLFGAELLNRNNKRYLKLGSTYMAFEAPRANASAGQVDHVSLAIKSLDMMKLHALLEQRDVIFQDYPSGRDTAVLDPDGTRLQLSPENGWSLLNPANFKPEAVAVTEGPIFRATGLDHVVFNVTNVAKAEAHYQKVLGPPSLRSADAVWFQTGTSRIGIAPAPSGQKPGVRYICISAANFDLARTTLAVRQSGLETESVDSPNAVRFRDPDGLRLQLVGS